MPAAGSLLAGDTREYRLGELIAEGGEGKVFNVEHQDEFVAKIYKELDLYRKEKLQLMISRSNKGLRKVCAWPITPLCDSTEQTVGFIMENLSGWQPLHNAYQIRTRLKRFPHHSYAFLVRVARNLATCVHHVHEEGFVIGDLNESNVFVNGKAMAKILDADSFQVPGPTRLYACKVGKAELMPPELQGHSLEGLVRTPEHDRFSLAVLVFQTLVFGRHPFAGTVDHQQELTLEACIERGYYAYTRRRDTPVKPPPYLNLNWLPEEIRFLFEQAFDPHAEQRPTAKEWYFALKTLETGLKTCRDNPSHQYWNELGTCPWCDLEDRWKIALFRPALSDPDQEYEVQEILGKIAAIRVPDYSGHDLVQFDYKGLDPAKLGGLETFFGRATKNWGWFIFCFFQLVNVLWSNQQTSFVVIFIVAIVLLALFAAFYSRSEVMVRRATRRLGGLAERWRSEADPSLYTESLQKYYDLANSLRDVKGTFDQRRQEYIEDLHADELDAYLSKSSIMIADAGPLGSEKLSYLLENGIKTAAQISRENLRRLPRLQDKKEQDALLNWRKTLEQKFWKSHNYKLTIHQERNLIVEVRKENDRAKRELEKAPTELEEIAERLRDRQSELAVEAEKHVSVLRQHGPRLLAIEGKKAS
jgi:DNA-binding helix-hairpin-helix protein with protein kinase domain